MKTVTIAVTAVALTTTLTVAAVEIHKHYEANFSPTFKANAMARPTTNGDDRTLPTGRARIRRSA